MKVIQWIFSISIAALIVIAGGVFLFASSVLAFIVSAVTTAGFATYTIAMLIKEHFDDKEKNTPKIK